MGVSSFGSADNCLETPSVFGDIRGTSSILLKEEEIFHFASLYSSSRAFMDRLCNWRRMHIGDEKIGRSIQMSQH